MTESSTRTPGSDAARAAGCVCPLEQPFAAAQLYWTEASCPLHGRSSSDAAALARSSGRVS